MSLQVDCSSQDPRSCHTLWLHQGALYAQAPFIHLFDKYLMEIWVVPRTGPKDGNMKIKIQQFSFPGVCGSGANTETKTGKQKITLKR